MGQTKNNGAAENLAANRNYKSTVFAMLFGDRERLLRLYNAISGKNYQDPEALEINTLENAIYMGMKNDLSFLIDDRLSLYEHQSTVNPNMPLRFLFYISDLYSGMTAEENLYGVVTCTVNGLIWNNDQTQIRCCESGTYIWSLGKDVFTTREAAEAALKQNNG